MKVKSKIKAGCAEAGCAEAGCAVAGGTGC